MTQDSQSQPPKSAPVTALNATNENSNHNKFSKSNTLEWLGKAVTLLSLLGVVLTLIGYGVALSVEERFNMPHAALFGSTFELLELSVWAVLQFLNNLPAALVMSKLYWAGLLGVWIPALILLASWIGIVLFVKRQRSNVSEGKFSTYIRILIKPPSFKTESKRMLLGRGVAYALLFLASAPLFFIFWVMLLVAVIVIFTFAPIVGLAAGQAHIGDYVVGPSACTSLLNRDARRVSDKTRTQADKDVKTATCISVTKDDKPLGRGRVVFATSEAVVLYDPVSGVVRRVPIKDAVVEVMDSL